MFPTTNVKQMWCTATNDKQIQMKNQKTKKHPTLWSQQSVRLNTLDDWSGRTTRTQPRSGSDRRWGEVVESAGRPTYVAPTPSAMALPLAVVIVSKGVLWGCVQSSGTPGPQTDH